MSRAAEPDDVDARFRAIMDTEFSAPQQKERPAGTGEPFNLSQALDEVEPNEPEEPFVPPRPSWQLPRGERLAGLALLLGSVVVALAGLVGAPVRTLGPWVVLAFVASLVLLFRSLPREPRDPDDLGARL